MPGENLARWQDLLVIAINLCVMVAIGAYCARKTKSADAFFLADRSMPGWVVGFSMMATIISSVTFLAIPGSTFNGDWRFMPAHALYFIPAIVGYFIFMPFFRQGNIRSAYEYLELRFGTWARMYGAVAFLFYHIFRAGIILYAVSLALKTMSGFPMPMIICVLGVLVAIYTILGGLEAVIYTDFIQGLLLVFGGLICVPIIAHSLDGGFSQIISDATAHNKFAVGSTAFNLDEKTVWVLILVYQFQFLQIICTDQNMVQRYLAMKTDQEARRGFILGTFLTIPTWLYFAFVGTALFVFYKQFPIPALDGKEPEEILPFFILTQIPAGVAGLVISGMLAAAMSTLDSSINASAATVTNDFFRRFHKTERDETHYLRVGRFASVFFSCVMIAVAMLIHLMRSETLMDVQTVVYPIVSAGLLSLFILGFVTTRVGSSAAAVATIATVLFVGVWAALASPWGAEEFPAIANKLPNTFWIGVVPHVFLLFVGYVVSLVLPRRSNAGLDNLTIWSKHPNQVP